MCFSPDWLLHLLIILIIVGVVVVVMRLWVYPTIAQIDARIPRTIDLVIGAVVAIIVLVALFDLLLCAMGSGLWLRAH